VLGDDAKCLGPVGGRIVVEVFPGLLQGDRHSYLRQHLEWQATLGSNGKFTMVDLLNFVARLTASWKISLALIPAVSSR
jgi:hypothetical protein